MADLQRVQWNQMELQSSVKSVPLFSLSGFMILSARSWVLPSSKLKRAFRTILMWLYTLNLYNCESVVKLRNWKVLSRRREWDNQPAVCQVSFHGLWCLSFSCSVCPLPKSRKWRKHSETTGSVMLMFCHVVIAWRVTWNGRICENNLSQGNYTRYYALERTVISTLYFIKCW